MRLLSELGAGTPEVAAVLGRAAAATLARPTPDSELLRMQYTPAATHWLANLTVVVNRNAQLLEGLSAASGAAGVSPSLQMPASSAAMQPAAQLGGGGAAAAAAFNRSLELTAGRQHGAGPAPIGPPPSVSPTSSVGSSHKTPLASYFEQQQQQGGSKPATPPGLGMLNSGDVRLPRMSDVSQSSLCSDKQLSSERLPHLLHTPEEGVLQGERHRLGRVNMRGAWMLGVVV